jgi:hypothetical protein
LLEADLSPKAHIKMAQVLIVAASPGFPKAVAQAMTKGSDLLAVHSAFALDEPAKKKTGNKNKSDASSFFILN